MADIQDLLNQLPIDQLAQQVGASPSEVQDAVSNALPALLMGLDANAQDPAGASSLQNALGAHSPSLLEGGINLNDVDVTDGQKITHNIFGDNEQAVVSKLGASSAGGEGLISKLMPMLAPIVMAWLAGKFMGVDKAQSAPAQTQSNAGGGILGGILGSILGGGQQASTSNSTSGGVFKTQAPSASDAGTPTMPMPDTSSSSSSAQTGSLGGGILGDLLGGLLGGGRR